MNNTAERLGTSEQIRAGKWTVCVTLSPAGGSLLIELVDSHEWQCHTLLIPDKAALEAFRLAIRAVL